MTKLEYIKERMSDKKLREDLLNVVPDVDALIPQSENEFSDIQKFGLYPAAALVLFTRDENVPIYFVDPVVPDTSIIQNPLTHINERGAVGLPMLVKKLREEFA